jgi:glutamate/tyrosine decarboxylase-like PLP-dependent enzyme
MNSLKLWLTLRMHGRQAYEDHIDRQLQLAREFAEWVENSEFFELAAARMLTIVNFRMRGKSASAELAKLHTQIVNEVTRDGRRWISDTIVNGQSVLRMMVISYLTEERHIRDLQKALEVAARTIAPAD